MSLAEDLKKQAFENVYSQIIMLVQAAVDRGETSAAVSYKFFKGNNALLKFIIEKLMEDGFTLRLYETKMEIRLEA